MKDKDHSDGDADANTFPERRRVLSKNITNIRVPQRLYMPGSEPLINAIDPVLLADHPENVELWFPSDLPSASRDAQCIPGLPKLEYQLRHAQAADALHNLRHFRRLIQTITIKTQAHISTTQRTTTRTTKLFSRAGAKQRQAISTYRAARRAIVELAPNKEFGPWKDTLLELTNNDVRGPRREEDEPPESRRVQSWIWTTASQVSTSLNDPDLHATLRVEWCKAQERAKRYEEEQELVVEEMRRTLATFKWNIEEWEAFAISPLPGAPSIDATTAIGIAAYAHKQANVQQRMIGTFVNAWYPTLERLSLGSSWIEEHPRPSDAKRHRLPSNVQLFHHTPQTPLLDRTNVASI